MKEWLERFESMQVRTQAIIVISVALIFGGILAAVVLGTDHDYTREQAAEDASAFCAEHDGVERFDYTYESDGRSEVICKDGSLAVFP